MCGKHSLKSCRMYPQGSRERPSISRRGALALDTTRNWHGTESLADQTRPSRAVCYHMRQVLRLGSLLTMKIERSGSRPITSRRTSKLHKWVVQTVALIPLDALHGAGILRDHSGANSGLVHRSVNVKPRRLSKTDCAGRRSQSTWLEGTAVEGRSPGGQSREER